MDGWYGIHLGIHLFISFPFGVRPTFRGILFNISSRLHSTDTKRLLAEVHTDGHRGKRECPSNPQRWRKFCKKKPGRNYEGSATLPRKWNVQFIYLDLPRGAEWMIRGAYTPSFRFQTAPFGRSCYVYLISLIFNGSILVVYYYFSWRHAKSKCQWHVMAR